MQFNAEAAKAAGYSDQEIEQYLAAHSAGYSPKEIDQFLDERPAQAPEADPKLEREIQTYLQRSPTPKGLGDLSVRYGVGIPNADAVVTDAARYGARDPTFAYKRDAESMPNALPKKPEEDFDYGNFTRSVLRGPTFGFADEAEAAMRTFMGSPFNAGNYRREKNRINADFDQWAKDNPKTAFAGEMAGDIGSMFIPGVGAIGNIAKATRGAKELGVFRTLGESALAGAKSGAQTGALAGAGASEDMGDLARSTVTGSAIGTVGGALLAPVFTGVGMAGSGLYNKVRGIKPEFDKGERMALGQLNEAANRESDADTIYKRGQMLQRYGVPYMLGDLSPELQKLTIKTARTRSEGQSPLLADLGDRMVGGRERVKDQIHSAFPSAGEYFKSEKDIVDTLRNTYDTLGSAAMDAGPVRDPKVMDLIHDPYMSRFWLEAKKMADGEVLLAKQEGRDPTKYELGLEMEPVLNAEGALVGLQPTGRNIPTVRTLDYLRRSMGDSIDKGFSGTGSSGKGVAGVESGLRKNLDKALNRVPAYAAYRTKYGGEKKVQEALRIGKEDFSKLRSEEVKNFFAKSVKDGGFSDAEKEAFTTGAVQHLMQPVETPSTLKDFAGNIVNSDSTREKLKLILPPKEFEVFNAALNAESTNFKNAAKALSGNPEMARITQQIEGEMASSGVSPASIIASAVNPTSRLTRYHLILDAINLIHKVPYEKNRDKMYTTLANAMRETDINKSIALLKKADLLDATNTARNEGVEKSARVTGKLVGRAGAAITDEPTPSAPAVEIAPLETSGEYQAAPGAENLEADSAAPKGQQGSSIQFRGVPLLAYEDGTFSTPEGKPVSVEQAQEILNAYRAPKK